MVSSQRALIINCAAPRPAIRANARATSKKSGCCECCCGWMTSNSYQRGSRRKRGEEWEQELYGDSKTPSRRVARFIVSDGMEGKGSSADVGWGGKKEERNKRKLKAITWTERVGEAKNIRMEEPTTGRHRNGGIVGISNKCKNHSSSACAMGYGVRMGVRLATLGGVEGGAHPCTGCHWCDGLLDGVCGSSTGTYHGTVDPWYPSDPERSTA